MRGSETIIELGKMEDEVEKKKPIVFHELISDFMRFYGEFDEAFRTAAHLLNQTCFLLFGVSGAGKSTTVARLVEDTPPEEFWEKLKTDKAANKTYSEVGGIYVGHTVNSCTVVPRPYSIGEYHIADMPGFAETDSQKKITIDFLQKCFLTRTKNFKILVVAEVGLVYQAKMKMLREDYHEALWKLLGEKYELAIPHLYFVLTKKEQMVDGVSLDDQLNKGLRDVMRHKANTHSALFAQFLIRMSEWNVVVDLETDTNESLLSKIERKIEAGEKQNKGTGRVAAFHIEELEAGENELDGLCLQHISKLAQRQRRLEQNLKVGIGNWAKAAKALGEESTAKRVEKVDAVAELEGVKEKHEGVTRDIETYPVTRGQLLLALERAQMGLEVARQKKRIFRDKFTDVPFINVRCDVSLYAYKKLMGAKPFYHIDLNAHVRSDGSESDFIVIMDYEENDDTIRKYINNHESIIPTRMEDIWDISVPEVLYNSKLNINRCGVVRLGTSEGDDGALRTLSLRHEQRFKVYIYSSRAFSDCHFYQEFEEQFDKEVRSAENEIAALHIEIGGLDEKHQNNKEVERELAEQLADLKQKIRTIHQDTVQLKDAHGACITATRNKIKQLEEDIKACQNDDLVPKIASVVEIFQDNSIGTRSNVPLNQFTTQFQKIWQKSSELASTIDHFEKEDMQYLMDIQGIGVA